jgi:hypothetical protein
VADRNPRDPFGLTLAAGLAVTGSGVGRAEGGARLFTSQDARLPAGRQAAGIYARDRDLIALR